LNIQQKQIKIESGSNNIRSAALNLLLAAAAALNLVSNIIKAAAGIESTITAGSNILLSTIAAGGSAARSNLQLAAGSNLISHIIIGAAGSNLLLAAAVFKSTISSAAGIFIG
jgi:hypothetical protein